MEGNNNDFYKDDEFDEENDFDEDDSFEDFEGGDNDLRLFDVFYKEEDVFFLFEDNTWKVLKCSTIEKAKILKDSVQNR